MEKKFYMCLLLLVAAWQMTWADCSLSLAPVSMNAGGKAVLGINLSNTEEVTAFQFDLRLPTGITIGTTINDDEETVLDIVLTERKKSSHQVTFSQQDDGRYTIAVLSGKNQSLKDNQGAVINIGVLAQASLPSGSYMVQIDNIHIVPLVDGTPGARIDQTGIQGTINVANAGQSDDVVALLSFANTELTAGGSQQIEIALENNIEITSMQFDVTLPAGITLNTMTNEDEEQVPDARLTSRRHSSHSINCAEQQDGSYRVVVLSSKNKPLSGSNGAVVTLGVTVPLTMSGIVTAKLSNIHLVPLVEGSPGIRIDANDVTQNITVSNQGSGDEPTGPVAMTVAPLTLQPGETGILYIDLNNDRNICSFQLKVKLPEGINVVKEYNDDDEYVEAISLTSERKKSSHDLNFKRTDDGGYFLLAYSTSNATFKGNSGHLVSIKVKADEEMSEGTYGVVLRDVVMTTPEEERITQDAYSAVITIGDSSGVGTPTSAESTHSTWYNLQGQKVTAGSRGMVIRRDVMSDGSTQTHKTINH